MPDYTPEELARIDAWATALVKGAPPLPAKVEQLLLALARDES